jgi:PAS domain-containing protein
MDDAPNALGSGCVSRRGARCCADHDAVASKSLADVSGGGLQRSAPKSMSDLMPPRHLTDLAQADRFQLLIDAVKDYAIYLLDADGHVATWNTGAQLFKGYTADEIIGRHFSTFYTEEDRAAGLPENAPCGPPRPSAGSNPRAGACARTARVSGPTW